jgi:hypothetical protein
MPRLATARHIDGDGVGVVGIVGLTLAKEGGVGRRNCSVVASADDPGGDPPELLGK